MKKAKWLFIVGLPLVIISAFLGSSLLAQAENDPAANKALWMEWWELEAQHDYSQIDRFFTEDVVRHSTSTAMVMPEVYVANRDNYLDFLYGTAAAFPDYQMIPEMVIAEDDLVAFYATFDGTAAVNGHHISVPMMGFARFEDGKVAELWIEWDNVTWSTRMAEVPVSNLDDVVGAWQVVEGSNTWRLELTEDNVMYLGSSGELEDLRHTVNMGEYILDGSQITFSGDRSQCSGTYDTFVTYDADGNPANLHFELVGSDCNVNRVASLDGKMLPLWQERTSITASGIVVEEPIASADDVIGAWQITVDGAPWRMELTPNNLLYVGASGRTEALRHSMGISDYVLDGNLITFSGGDVDCDATYEVFVTRGVDGVPTNLRFELIGNDCHETRVAALDGNTISLWLRD